MLSKFCPKCGKETEKFSGKVCEECAGGNDSEKRELFSIPDVVRIGLCRCGSVRIGGEWKKYGSPAEAVDSAVKSEMKKDRRVIVSTECADAGDLESPRPGKIILEALVSAIKGDEAQKESVRIMASRDCCPSCSRASGGYYEAIIQVRSKRGEELRKRIESAFNGKGEKSFISKKVEGKWGTDYYVGSCKEAKSLANALKKEYHLNIRISHTVAGKKDGKELRRTTFALKDPEE